MSWTLTATRFSGTPAAVPIEATGISLTRRSNTWAELSFTVAASYALFDDEASTDNPLTVGSYVTWARNGTTEFYGVIKDITRNEADACSVDVLCVDPLWWANKAVASVDGVKQFGMTSPVADLTSISLGYLGTQIGHPPEDAYPVYPLFTVGGSIIAPNTADPTSPWMAKGACPYTTTLGTLNISQVLFTVTDIRQFAFPCLIQVENELVYCSHGYYDTDGDAQIAVAARGVLGTTEANHSAGKTVYQRLLKPIADTGKASMLYPVVGVPTPIGTDKYRVREGGSYFAFLDDPSGYTNLNGEYSVYDMDNASALTLADFVTEVLTAATSVQGAGFSAGDIDTTGLDTIRIPRITTTRLRYSLEAINQQINESGLTNTTTSRGVLYYYDAAAAKITFSSISQGTATAVMPFAQRKVDAVSLETLYNGVTVSYQCDEPFSLVSSARTWHPAIGDATANGPLINAIMYQQLERANGAGWNADTSTAGNNLYTDALMDNNPATGWGLRANGVMAYSNTSPVPWQYLCVKWFTGSSTIDYASFTIDWRNAIVGTVAYELVGLTAYAGSGLPVEANVVRLSKYLYASQSDLGTRAEIPAPYIGHVSKWEGR